VVYGRIGMFLVGIFIYLASLLINDGSCPLLLEGVLSVTNIDGLSFDLFPIEE